MIAQPKHIAMQATCDVVQVSLEALYGDGRHERSTLARRVATVILREDYDLSFPEIAMAFGKSQGNRIAWEWYQFRHTPNVIDNVRQVRTQLRMGMSIADRLTSLESQVATLRQMVCNNLNSGVAAKGSE